MRKILKKIGLTLLGTLVSIKLWIVKVYANISIAEVQPAYGVIDPTKEPKTKIIKPNSFILSVIIPIVFVIGIIVYCIKSKSSILKKIIVTLGIVVLYIIIRGLYILYLN